jgi:hypothetical protein
VVGNEVAGDGFSAKRMRKRSNFRSNEKTRPLTTAVERFEAVIRLN